MDGKSKNTGGVWAAPPPGGGKVLRVVNGEENRFSKGTRRGELCWICDVFFKQTNKQKTRDFPSGQASVPMQGV